MSPRPRYNDGYDRGYFQERAGWAGNIAFPWSRTAHGAKAPSSTVPLQDKCPFVRTDVQTNNQYYGKSDCYIHF
jgi:hypothetical protein